MNKLFFKRSLKNNLFIFLFTCVFPSICVIIATSDFGSHMKQGFDYYLALLQRGTHNMWLKTPRTHSRVSSNLKVEAA